MRDEPAVEQHGEAGPQPSAPRAARRAAPPPGRSRRCRGTTRSARSSPSSMSRSTSVSSAMVKPGSRSASSGNSRSSERQNASMVLIAMSPSRSRRSRQRAASISPVAAALWRLCRMRSRISAAALRVKVIARMLAGSTPRLQQVGVAIDEHARLARAGGRLEHDVPRRDPRQPRDRRRRADPTAAGAAGSSNGRRGVDVLERGDIILPAHAGIRARGAQVRLHGRGGKTPRLDRRRPRRRIAPALVERLRALAPRSGRSTSPASR